MAFFLQIHPLFYADAQVRASGLVKRKKKGSRMFFPDTCVFVTIGTEGSSEWVKS